LTAPTRDRRLIQLSVGVAVVTVDVLTKNWASSHWSTSDFDLVGDRLRLAALRNPGAAFGLGSGFTPLIAALAMGVVVALIATAGRPRSRLTAVACGLVLGGALGNLVDRLFRPPGPMRGWVVDWIDLAHWPTFNLADVAINVAAAFFVVAALRAGPSERRDIPSNESEHHA
jgi:signal peptidase II